MYKANKAPVTYFLFSWCKAVASIPVLLTIWTSDVTGTGMVENMKEGFTTISSPKNIEQQRRTETKCIFLLRKRASKKAAKMGEEKQMMIKSLMGIKGIPKNQQLINSVNAFHPLNTLT